MRLRRVIAVIGVIVAAVVLQTTLFARLDLISPDLVLLASIMFSLTRIRPEAVLGLAFTSGLVVDLIGSSLLGLRAVVFTIVAFVAIRTRDRADIGRVSIAIWCGLLTLLGILGVLLIGTLFGQSTLLGSGTQWEILVVPLVNTAIAWIVSPMFVRLVDGSQMTPGFT